MYREQGQKLLELRQVKALIALGNYVGWTENAEFDMMQLIKTRHADNSYVAPNEYPVRSEQPTHRQAR